MATTSTRSGGKSTRKTPARKTRSAAAPRASATTRRSTGRSRSTRTTRATAQVTIPTTPLQQAGVWAERAVLVPVGASLLARDNLVATVRGLASRYSTRTNLEHEIRRYERRGSTARNRFERQVRRSRTQFERQLRQRRNLIERTIKQNRRRLEREVRSVRRDLNKQSGVLSGRVEKIVSDAQELIGSSL